MLDCRAVEVVLGVVFGGLDFEDDGVESEEEVHEVIPVDACRNYTAGE